jgi:hypothetical protein
MFEGYNITCMAYGITGAGKTYTMLGNGNESVSRDEAISGISVMAIQTIFMLLSQYEATDT